jgi:hypothetical protein
MTNGGESRFKMLFFLGAACALVIKEITIKENTIENTVVIRAFLEILGIDSFYAAVTVKVSVATQVEPVGALLITLFFTFTTVYALPDCCP